MGVKFPLAYLLLEPWTGSAFLPRVDCLSGFLNAVKQKLLELRPEFFFMDKEVAHINAIKTIFHIDPSLCLWNLKRAIKRRVADLRKGVYVFRNGNNEIILLKIVDAHFFRSPVFSGKNSQDLRSDELQEILQFLNINEEDDLLQYLISNWYFEGSWKLWGRRHASKVSFRRTTVRVKAHWSVLKRL